MLRLRQSAARFYQYWSLSLPSEHVHADNRYAVRAAYDLAEVTFSAQGTQHAFVTTMADFFFRMGASRAELLRLHHLGQLLQLRSLGSWISASAAGALDGGWCVRASLPLPLVLHALDAGPAARALTRLARHHSWSTASFVRRDMAAAPPHHTELHVPLGVTGDAARLLGEACEALLVPAAPADALRLLASPTPSPSPSPSSEASWSLVVVVSGAQVERLGLLRLESLSSTVEAPWVQPLFESLASRSSWSVDGPPPSSQPEILSVLDERSLKELDRQRAVFGAALARAPSAYELSWQRPLVTGKDEAHALVRHGWNLHTLYDL